MSQSINLNNRLRVLAKALITAESEERAQEIQDEIWDIEEHLEDLDKNDYDDRHGGTPWR